jgi:hypothetical protein
MAVRIPVVVAWADTMQSCRYTAYTSTVISRYALLPIYQTSLRHILEDRDINIRRRDKH